ncbi:MAG TPA: aldehyde dehydrogenase family protein [Solirubrobacteraceae bacterium]|nr:aldehyde dehydrogenase family protein [Solirubrobacteraceae bacterium]
MSVGTIVCRNPADTRQVVARYAAHDAQGVAQACARAAAAQPAWGALPGPRRGELLYRAAELVERRVERLARTIVAEEGKLLADAAGEVRRAAAVLRFHAGEAERGGGQLADAAQPGAVAFTRRRPLGVVGLITPWNFPIAIPAWKLAPALAAGNAALIKPASAAPGATLGLLDALHEAGVPHDVAQAVLGGAQVGGALVDDPRVRAVSFTGSTAVGRELAGRVTARGARFQGELGGNNPLVVLADADPALAVELACEGAFAAAGQKCTATRRVIVQEPLYQKLLEAFARRARGLRMGAGDDPAAQVPPLIDSAAAETALQAVVQARTLGATVLAGGERPDGALRHGSFLAPTVLAGAQPGMRVNDEEVFGPVCAVLPARDLDEAIELANAVPYGLSASVCTTDLAAAMRFVAGCEAGMVHVNRPTPGADPHMPFGGLKASTASGWREQGGEAVRFFSEQQTVYVHGGERAR